MEAEPAAIRVEELLEHAGWVRALARRLVRDSGVADDLVQETWLAALRRPPADRRNLRGWLGRVVTHAARKRGRQVAPAALAGEPASAPEPPPDLAEAVETQQALVRLVLELEEPYRATVILRYWHDLDSPRIARRLGVPAGTVRWRLKEGLERLRARLDATHGGDRRAWCLALAPLLRRGAAGAGSAALPLLWKGLLGMPLALKLSACAAALVLVLLGLRALRVESPGRAPAAASALALERAGGAGLAPERLEPVRRRPLGTTEARSTDARAVAGSGASALGRITARLLDREGRPLADGTVSLMQPRVESAASAADGAVLLEVDLERGATSLELVFLAPAHAQRVVELVARPGEEVELGDIVLGPGGRVAGRVLGPDGRPLAGASVQYAAGPPPAGDLERARRERTAHGGHWLAPRSDAGGRFVLRGVPVGRGHLWADHEGQLASPSRGFVLEAGQEILAVDIALAELPREDVIAGIVLDGHGDPVPFAPVHFDYRTWFSGGSHMAVTDRAGRFEELCESGGARRVQARDPDGRWGDAVIEGVRPGTSGLVLQLSEPETVPLVVVDQEGRAVVSPTVACFTDDRRIHLGPRRPPQPGPEGALELPVPGLSFLLLVSAEGHEEVEVGPLDPGALPERIAVILHTLPGLHGAARAGGEPLQGATVEVFLEAEEYAEIDGFPARVMPGPAATGRTDDAGHFRVTVRERGRYLVRVEAAGLAAREVGPLGFDPGQGLDVGTLVLDQGGTLEGHVLEPDGASPAGRIVGITRGDGHARTQRVGADGRYRFEHLIPGPWQVELRERELHPDGSSSATDSFRPVAELHPSCIVAPGRTTVLDLSAGDEPACVLAGQLSVDGRPAAGWEARLLATTAAGIAPRTSGPASATVDAEGQFRLATAAQGAHWLSLRSGDLALLARVHLESGTRRFAADLAMATLDVEGLAPRTEERTPAAMYVWGTGDRLAVSPLYPDDAGRVAGLRIPAGPGRLVPFDPAAPLADPETLLQSAALLDVDLAPGAHEHVRLP